MAWVEVVGWGFAAWPVVTPSMKAGSTPSPEFEIWIEIPSSLSL